MASTLFGAPCWQFPCLAHIYNSNTTPGGSTYTLQPVANAEFDFSKEFRQYILLPGKK